MSVTTVIPANAGISLALRASAPPREPDSMPGGVRTFPILVTRRRGDAEKRDLV